VIAAAFVLLLGAPHAQAQELVGEHQDILSAVVTRIVEETTEWEGFDVQSDVQVVRVSFLEGEQKGKEIELKNDYGTLSIGDRVYVSHTVHVGGEEYYSLFERDRSGALLLVIALFVGAVVLLGGLQGIRALLSLIAGLGVVTYALVPSLMAGYPPVAVSVFFATIILAVAIFATHGFTRGSTIAFVGTVSAVALTGILATYTVALAGFTGFASDDAVYLNLATKGALDIVGLLLAGIIIGVLGVLDDIAITQVAVVSELYHAQASLSIRDVFTRAMRVGRDHASALVNTLVLAYAGASLPLLLLFSQSTMDPLLIVNREVFAVEIMRALIGSIGLMMTVPITTFLAAYFMRGHEGSLSHGHTH
jgi:uncharacterized membrane protein